MKSRQASSTLRTRPTRRRERALPTGCIITLWDSGDDFVTAMAVGRSTARPYYGRAEAFWLARA